MLNERTDIQREIEQFIRGNLSMDDIDSLWVKFLENSEWFTYFETELHLRAMGKENLNLDA